MKAECIESRMDFQRLNQRAIIGQFDGGHIPSDGGGILLRDVENKARLLEDFAKCYHQSGLPKEVPVVVAVYQRLKAGAKRGA